MKKLVFALMAALLLTGCSTQTQVPETTLPPVETTMPTEPEHSCYVENSPMERGTGGAVKLYQMEDSITGLGMLGENLLLCTGGDTLELYDSTNMEQLRTRELEHELSWNDPSLVISGAGMAYFDDTTGTYVTLDNNLITASTFVVEEQMLSRPVITSDFSDIYFAAEEGVRVMHLSEGTSRILREEHNPVVSVDGLLFGDGTLRYTRRTTDGGTETCFVDSGDGSMYQTADFQGQILSRDGTYAGLMKIDHAMGKTLWVVTGDLEGRLARLAPDKSWDSAMLLNNGWAVFQSSSQVGLTLYCYDVADGTMVAQVIMPQQYYTMALCAVEGTKIWLSDGAGSRLYCWDTAVNPRAEAGSVLAPYASLGEPDTDGMEQVKHLALVTGDRYGVKISFAEENNRTPGLDYSGHPDYRPELYTQAVRELEKALRELPGDFLRRVGRMTEPGELEICLVDDYDPGQKTTAATGSIDVTGGNAAIRVSMCGNLREIFFHELFHVLEIQIMNYSDGFKWWEHINPDEFEYVNSYAPYYDGELKASPWLKGEKRYFADDYGLVSAREDRAQIFVYACMDDQEARFASWGMQKKLGQICDKIRECFGITDGKVPVWEQYLLEELPPEPTEPTEPVPATEPTEPTE